jgi:hypothetical protein
MNQTLTPTKRLLLWVINQGGSVRWTEYHQKGIELGCPPPAQNSLFGTRVPSMVRDGEFRVVTEVGRERGRRYSLLHE